MTRVINFFGGPGSGKSTFAAGLFYNMKSKDIKCELVNEYAKELVWDNRLDTLEDQLYVLAKQHRKLQRLNGKVDYIITDAALLNTLYYNKDGKEILNDLCLDLNSQYDNINLFVKRKKKYQEYGRTQTLAEAREIDSGILTIIKRIANNYATPSSMEDILYILKNHYDVDGL